MLHITGLLLIYYGSGSNGRGKSIQKEKDTEKDKNSKADIQMSSKTEGQQMEEPHE